MLVEFLQATAVLGSLFLLVVLPFLPLSRVLFEKSGWPKIVLSAMVIGSCLQAVLGLFWTHLIGTWPHGEVVLWGVICSAVLFWGLQRVSWRSMALSKNSVGQPAQFQLQLVLLAAVLVRMIHPLTVAYLGQSDAYTHLNYIHNISEFGKLINPVYPPGYHWIMSLPALVFSVDPYWIARFAGAFFGVGLVLAVFVLLEEFFDTRTALFGSFCAACFPLMTLLLKTGVGVFANQFGIFLVPVVLIYYRNCAYKNSKIGAESAIFILALCGFAVSVPMMLLHLLLILCLERCVVLFRQDGNWLSTTIRVSALILPALCLLVFHVSLVGSAQRFQTANILVEYGGKKQAVAESVSEKVEASVTDYFPATKDFISVITGSPYFRLLYDYLTVKRFNGFGNVYLNALSSLLALLFFGFLIYGIIARHKGYILLGCWGIVTSIQATTGALQFSSYQREGWSLLVATCCLSGIIAAYISQVGWEIRYFRYSITVLMISAFIWTLVHPPRHPAILSPAEGQIIRTARFLGKGIPGMRTSCKMKENKICGAIEVLDEEQPLTVVSRSFSGWGNQGEIIENVLPSDTSVRAMVAGKRNKRIEFRSDRQYIVLVDKKSSLSSQQITSAFAMVTPDMVEATLRNREYLFRANDRLVKYIKSLSESQWRIRHLGLTDLLDLYVIVPISRLN